MRILVGRNHAMINRAAYARVPPFTPTDTGEVALYNNSAGPHVLVVWDFTRGASQIDSLGYLIKNAKLTTLVVGGVHSAIAGEPTPIGAVYQDDLASPDVIQVDNNNSQGWFQTNVQPLAVLLPGWSIIFVASTAATLYGGSFQYQWLYAEEYGYNARSPEYEIQ